MAIINLIQSEESENTYINTGDIVPADDINQIYNLTHSNNPIQLHNINSAENLLINLGFLAPLEDINESYNNQ